MSYTPGPWTRQGLRIYGPRGGKIGAANTNNGIANAQLMTTAPELLEAAKSFAANANPENYAALHQVIAKAEGK